MGSDRSESVRTTEAEGVALHSLTRFFGRMKDRNSVDACDGATGMPAQNFSLCFGIGFWYGVHRWVAVGVGGHLGRVYDILTDFDRFLLRCGVRERKRVHQLFLCLRYQRLHRDLERF